ncbi:DNA cytosine methyltransferase [Hydrogenophaga sp.]|uniref:DNA cytosine methyltransferase n=1 Tax=Hydrogenophaga sp. TaxID=1904254 RepID=UPI00273172E6|nr:DNA cytosine methyltransferase [Hydrogenophaga sp.]MDP2074604.1 DNA cytosine methyltransferase [Hydrogenophaga sp.]MDP3106427.1 DNA cytosine methyltransferase [Hydrogenophaga sp.]
MLNPQFILPIASELVVDLFAGGGGASTGIEQAIGRHVDIAINHDPEAVSLHEANHPQTRHFVSDVFEVDPLVVTDGQPVGLLWASPDCKHFSKAKGGKPVSKKIRSLAWVVVKWAKAVRPRVICLENVEEFQTWGPLGADNMPCPRRKGATFARWKRSLEGLGYVVEHRELRACDYGAPTIRKRLFLVARRDGQPVVWPEATHAAPDSLPVRQKKLKPWRTAAECIDWSVPAPSIFERTRPLADATCRRIAKGIVRYVIDAAEPFIVGVGGRAGQSPERPMSKAMGTITSKGDAALCVPTIISMGYGERPGQQPRVPGIEVPLSTITAQGQHQGLVSAFLAKHYTGVVGSDLAAPMGTATTVDHHSLVAANLIHMGHGEGKDGGKRFSHGVRDVEQPLNTVAASGMPAGIVTSHMLKMRGDNVGSGADEPLHTISAQGTHHAEVQAFLIKYYGTDQDPALREPLHTVTTKDRFGLVMVKGEPYAIVDIGLRMLTPRELYRAQGFPESYRIDLGADGRPLTKTAQVRMCGNSVCPPLARALVAANYVEMVSVRAAA